MARRDVDTKMMLRYVSSSGYNFTTIARDGRKIYFRTGLGNLPRHTPAQARHIAKKLIQFADDIEKGN